MQRGTLMVVSGPAGVGKGTVIKDAISKAMGNVLLSISATTRAPRAGDIENETYYFKSRDEFQKMIKDDEILEWAIYSDNYYGTPKKPVFDALEKGIDVILEIEVQGAMTVRAHQPEAVFVFIAPPSAEELECRLRGRQTETPDEIQKRLEISKIELQYIEKYNFVVVNNSVDQASNDLLSILRTDKLTKERYLTALECDTD